MKRTRYIILLSLMMALSSCNDYLSKIPSPSTSAPINNVEQLMAIYDNATAFISETNPFACFTNDDADLSAELFKAKPSSFPVSSTVFYTIFHTDGISSQASDGLWSGQYSNIFKANTIINNVDNVTGDATEKAKVKCNAHFLRAYSYFLLAQYYCLPYCEANKTALGLPKRLGVDFEESIARVSLEEIYQLILSDLELAATTPEENVNSDYPWRVTKATVNALLSRIYLTMGKYNEAQTAAENALKGAPELLDLNELDYADVEKYPEENGLPAQDVYNCETDKWNTIKYLYWKEFIFPRFTYARSQWLIPSDDLVNLYDHDNDRRFKLYFVEHGNRRMGVPYEAYRYNQFYDGRYIVSGLTTAEMLLVKAEAQIRQGEWQEGLKTLDILRMKRYDTGKYTALTASSQSEALSIVIAERRREMPFSARISDIKRYSVNETSEDDVTVVRNFFEISMSEVFTDKPKTYTIPSNSLLWAMPINEVEIGSSKGAIQQNRYE